VKVEGMRHVWSLQEGELFSKCVKKLVWGRKVADELELLWLCCCVSHNRLLLCAATKTSDL
jgi:hypothetical protein